MFLWPRWSPPINRFYVLPRSTHNPTQQQVQAMMRSFIHSCSLLSSPLYLSRLPFFPLQDAPFCLPPTNSQLISRPWDATCRRTHTNLRLGFITLLPHLLEELSDGMPHRLLCFVDIGLISSLFGVPQTPNTVPVKTIIAAKSTDFFPLHVVFVHQLKIMFISNSSQIKNRHENWNNWFFDPSGAAETRTLLLI